MWQNRQKCAQKQPFCGVLRGKMGKFHLQTPKITHRTQKTRFSIVNFLKRRFDRRVNFGGSRPARGRVFKIVFLDITGKLCYYIIYIWENSAQNCPIGGVCLTCTARMHLVKPPFTCARTPAEPERAGVLRALARGKQKQSTGKKVVNSCRRKRA